MAATSLTYLDGSVREDLLGVITNISPKETQLMSGLGTSTCNQIVHNWLTDALTAVKTNHYAEAQDASYAVTEPARAYNATQIIRQGYQVSGTQQAVDHAGFADRFAYEASKAMSIWKNDAELAVLQGCLCTATAAARNMCGIVNFMYASNVTNQSGISMSEDNLIEYLRVVWDAGASVDEVYVGAKLKKRIDGFTAGSTKNVDQSDKRLWNAVDVYESSFAPLVKIFLHRYADTDTTTLTIANGHNIIGIASEYYKVAYLRKPKMVDLPAIADAVQGEIVGELTMEDRAAGKAGFVGQNVF